MSEEMLSNEELKRKLAAEHSLQETREFNFPTEVITLPSRGLIYPEDNPLSSGKVELKYMTAREEDILTTDSYIKQGTVIDKLLESVIVSNGEGLPVKYVDLVTGDKNAIMIAVRILAYGHEYQVEVNDPFSDEKQKETIDLNQFESKEFDESLLVQPHSNEFEFTLPISKRSVTFMVLTESKERKIKHQLKDQEKKSKKFKDETKRELTTRLKNTILSVDGDYDQKKIDHFVDNELFSKDSLELRKYMTKVAPNIDLTWTFVSDETGEEQEMQMPMEIQFFWPGVSE